MITIKELRCPKCNRLLGKADGEGKVELHCKSKECKTNYTFDLDNNLEEEPLMAYGVQRKEEDLSSCINEIKLYTLKKYPNATFKEPIIEEFEDKRLVKMQVEI